MEAFAQDDDADYRGDCSPLGGGDGGDAEGSDGGGEGEEGEADGVEQAAADDWNGGTAWRQLSVTKNSGRIASTLALCAIATFVSAGCSDMLSSTRAPA